MCALKSKPEPAGLYLRQPLQVTQWRPQWSHFLSGNSSVTQGKNASGFFQSRNHLFDDEEKQRTTHLSSPWKFNVSPKERRVVLIYSMKISSWRRLNILKWINAGDSFVINPVNKPLFHILLESSTATAPIALNSTSHDGCVRSLMTLRNRRTALAEEISSSPHCAECVVSFVGLSQEKCLKCDKVWNYPLAA